MTLTRRSGLWLLLALLVVGVSAATFAFWPRSATENAAAAIDRSAPGRGLASFESDDELRDFLRNAVARRGIAAEEEAMDATTAAPMAAPAPAAESRSAGAPESITNNQEVGVDEGGIVKPYRDMLVILRRGRLFTVSLAGGGMRPVSSINAFPPEVSGRGDWYDEMLVSGDRVVVIGYSYARGGTEVNRFRIAPDGRLSFEDAYHLRSNDYYSSRNYASRLVGNRLVYYTPLHLGRSSGDPLDALPGVRNWGKDGSTRAFNRIADARRVFIAPRVRDDDEADISAMHSVISCDLTAAELDCDATAVLGPESRNFYVSSNAVYLFVNSGRPSSDGRASPATIYRLPFAEAERPSAIGARGAPIDQFSFREDMQGGRLDVMLQPTGGGDAMWGPERADGRAFALLQVPLGAFGDGSEEADRDLYRMLPPLPGQPYDLHNRFVGDYLLYGAGGGYGDRGERKAVVAVPVSGGDAATLALAHSVDRIEVLGSDALVVGAMNADLGFTAIDLGGGAPRVGERYVQRAASEGESRSHAFFYSPDGSDGDTGTVGLPIARPVEERYRRFFGSAASMLFLRRDDGGFRPAGELDARPESTVDDACQASCTDWYGNARPIFLRGRIYALLGYELVEGRMSGGRIGEVRRVNFAPGAGERRAATYWD